MYMDLGQDPGRILYSVASPSLTLCLRKHPRASAQCLERSSRQLYCLTSQYCYTRTVGYANHVLSAYVAASSVSNLCQRLDIFLCLGLSGNKLTSAMSSQSTWQSSISFSDRLSNVVRMQVYFFITIVLICFLVISHHQTVSSLYPYLPCLSVQCIIISSCIPIGGCVHSAGQGQVGRGRGLQVRQV